MSDSAAIEKKIEELENEMARTQKNKATNYREYHWLPFDASWDMIQWIFAFFFEHLLMN